MTQYIYNEHNFYMKTEYDIFIETQFVIKLQIFINFTKNSLERKFYNNITYKKIFIDILLVLVYSHNYINVDYNMNHFSRFSLFNNYPYVTISRKECVIDFHKDIKTTEKHLKEICQYLNIKMELHNELIEKIYLPPGIDKLGVFKKGGIYYFEIYNEIEKLNKNLI